MLDRGLQPAPAPPTCSWARSSSARSASRRLVRPGAAADPRGVRPRVQARPRRQPDGRRALPRLEAWCRNCSSTRASSGARRARGRHAQLRRDAGLPQPRRDFNVTAKTSLYLFGQVPVYQRVNGFQLEPKWSLSAGVHAAFYAARWVPDPRRSCAASDGAVQPVPAHAPRPHDRHRRRRPHLSRIVAGAWRMGDWNFSVDERVRWIEGCLDLGITTFDHADIYGGYARRGLVRRGAGRRAAPARAHADRHQVRHPHGLAARARSIASATTTPRPRTSSARSTTRSPTCAPTTSTCC